MIIKRNRLKKPEEPEIIENTTQPEQTAAEKIEPSAGNSEKSSDTNANKQDNKVSEKQADVPAEKKEEKQTQSSESLLAKQENPEQNKQTDNNEPVQTEEEKVEPVIEEPPPKPIRKPKTKRVDLDLSLDEIKFEPREERREGTRRRGYRRTEDRNLVSRAQHDAGVIKESAKKDGYNEGIANAKKDLEEFKNKLSDFYKLKDEVFEKVSGCIFDISLEMAKKILNKEPETNKEYLIPMIKAAIEEVNRTENKIMLKVMPKDVEIVKDKLPDIFNGTGIDATISVVPDKTIKDGGVVVETSNGIIDATIETQLAIMEQTILNAKGD